MTHFFLPPSNTRTIHLLAFLSQKVLRALLSITWGEVSLFLDSFVQMSYKSIPIEKSCHQESRITKSVGPICHIPTLTNDFNTNVEYQICASSSEQPSLSKEEKSLFHSFLGLRGRWLFHLTCVVGRGNSFTTSSPSLLLATGAEDILIFCYAGGMEIAVWENITTTSELLVVVLPWGWKESSGELILLGDAPASRGIWIMRVEFNTGDWRIWNPSPVPVLVLFICVSNTLGIVLHCSRVSQSSHHTLRWATLFTTIIGGLPRGRLAI